MLLIVAFVYISSVTAMRQT